MKYSSIEGFPDHIVSTESRVYCLRRGKITPIAIQLDKDGYQTVRLYLDGMGKWFKIHRLLAKCFLKNYTDGLEINHINGLRSDNRLDNLELVTHKENMAHSLARRLNNGTFRSSSAKLQKNEVVFLKNYSGTMQKKHLALIFGIHRSTLRSLQVNNTWKYLDI